MPVIDPDGQAERAVALFGAGDYLCAEAVLLTLAEAAGLGGSCLPRIATGFCSGLSRTCGPCGAVTGAVMAIGLALGRTAPRGDLDPAYAAVNEFIEGFTGRHGSIDCQALLDGIDLGEPEGQARYRAEDGRRRCQEFIRSAVRLALPVLRAGG